MRPAALLRYGARETRGARGRLLFFVGCLAIGVAAVVGVAGLVSGLERGIAERSRQLLGADLAVRSLRPLPEDLGQFLAGLEGATRADVRELATMASLAPPRSSAGGAPLDAGETRGASRLVELKVVPPNFPLVGELRLEPQRPLAELLSARHAVIAPELAQALGVEVGGSLFLGGVPYEVAGLVLEEPDRLDFRLALGPRVLISHAGLERTALIGFGSRVRHEALVRFDPAPSAADLGALRQRLRAELPGAAYLRIETHDQAQPRLRRALDQLGQYLGLAALLSLVLGGVGVAQAVRTWVAGRTQAIAVLRCLGLAPREVLALYLAHALTLGLLGSLVGVALGSLVPLLLPRLAPDLLPPGLVSPFSLGAALRGLGLGTSLAVLFALPPLTAVWRVSPARVLREEAEPLAAPRGVRLASWALLGLGIFGAAWAQSGELLHAASFTGGLALAALLLTGGARGLLVLAARVPRRRLGPYLVHGLAALARPGAGTTAAVVALGLGLGTIGTLLLVERRLGRELASALPEDAPSAFLVDVQPDQWPGVRALIVEHGGTAISSVPVLTARLAALDGVSTDELAAERRQARGEGRRGGWTLTREQRLTWLDALPGDNVVVEGALWSDPERDEISLEREFARELGVGIGSTLTFDVQGVPVDLLVTSLRDVEWRSFGINFFLVVEPGVLEDAPHFRLAAARLPAGGEQALQDRLAADFPNITLLRVRPILERVFELLTRAALGLRILGAFTIAAGIAILAGAVAAGNLRRAREAALLKTLGIARGRVALLFAVEHVLVGLVAGAIGAAGAVLASRLFLARALELSPTTPLLPVLALILGGALLSALAGLAASARALASPPIRTLRAG